MSCQLGMPVCSVAVRVSSRKGLMMVHMLVPAPQHLPWLGGSVGEGLSDTLSNAIQCLLLWI